MYTMLDSPFYYSCFFSFYFFILFFFIVHKNLLLFHHQPILMSRISLLRKAASTTNDHSVAPAWLSCSRAARYRSVSITHSRVAWMKEEMISSQFPLLCHWCGCVGYHGEFICMTCAAWGYSGMTRVLSAASLSMMVTSKFIYRCTQSFIDHLKSPAGIARLYPSQPDLPSS